MVLDYPDIMNLVFEYVTKYDKENDFKTASYEMKELIYSLTKQQVVSLVLQIGIIPEKIEHDSKEEKLYSKISEILLGKCFEELGFETSIYDTRSETADVLVKSKYHNYTLVSDAKAFRLSRTAKNQKDFKVDSMGDWRGDNDCAVLFCPYFQYPKKSSAIFKQSLDRNVSLLSWEHLAFFINCGIKENFNFSLRPIWDFSEVQKQRTLFSQAEGNYFEQQNLYISEKLNFNNKQMLDFIEQAKLLTIERCKEEKKYWQSKIEAIKNLTKEEAISSLISALKIEQKIERIEFYQKDLLKC